MPRLNSDRIRSVEFRAVDTEGGDGHTLEGYAATFNDPTEINSWEGNFKEHLAPTAFNKTLRDNPNVLMQFDHGRDVRTGSTPIGVYSELKPDSHGLHVKGRLFDNDLVKPIRDAVAGKAIRGMSFRFTPVRDSWEDAKGKPVDPDELESLLYGHRSADEDRLPLKRTLHEVKLHEAGPVVNPAYVNTTVGVRSLDDMSPEDIEAARAALIDEYRRTMTRSAEPEAEGVVAPVVDDADRSGASDGDDDEDDTLEFDHFATDIPVREDGLPDVDDSEYDADDDAGRAAKDPKMPYGKVTYADPGHQADGKSRYPVDTAEHTKAAWSYINMPKNAAKYAADKLGKVKANIKAAAKKFGIKVDEKKSADESGAARTEGTPDPIRASLLDAGFTAEEADEMLGIQRSADAAPSGTSDTPEDDDTRKVVSMKTKEEFEARQAEIAERFKALLGETRDKALDEAQDKEWQELVAERKSNATELEKIEERRALVESLDAEGSSERGDGSRAPRTPNFTPDRDAYDYESLDRAAHGLDEERAERYWKDAAERAIEKAKFAPAPPKYKGAQSGDVITSLLDTVADGPEDLAKRMVLTGSPVYEAAYRKFLRHRNDAFMTNEERQVWIRAQELSVGSAGGFAIPFQLDPTLILTNAGTVNPIRKLARTIQITGKQYDWVTTPGATATRGAELAVVGDGSITLAQPNVVTNRVQVFIPFSYEADMAWNNIRAELTKTIVDAKDREEDSFWTGNGTGTAPQGVVGYAATAGVVAYTTSATGEFSAIDVHGTYDLLPPRFEDNAVWAAHKSLYGAIRQFDTAGGAELWARIGDGQPATLLDQQAVRVSAMAALSAGVVPASSVLAVLGDFSEFVIVDRVGMNVELIPQVFDATTARPTGQRGLYATWMNNSVIRVPQAFVTLNSHA